LTETTAIFKVPRGTAYITAQQLVIYASSFVYYIVLIRVLNLSQIGEVSLLAAASAGFTTITQLALPLAATRFISASIGGKDSSIAGFVARTSLRLVTTIALPVLVLSVLASPWIASTVFEDANATSFLVVAFAGSFVLDFKALYGAYFLGLGRYAEMMYQNVLYHPLSRGFGLVLAYKGLGPLGIPAGWAIGAGQLGTTAGAIGRALLASGMMILGWWTLRRILHVPLTQGLFSGALVAILTAPLLTVIDYTLATNIHLTPLLRLPTLIIVYVVSFPIITRQLSVFTEADFELLRNALPQRLSRSLQTVERFLIRKRELQSLQEL